jgi:High potential iron-sulfur protein
MKLIIVRKKVCRIGDGRLLRFFLTIIISNAENGHIFPPTGPFTMHNKMTRRAMVKGSLLAGALVPAIGLIGNATEAAALTPLDPNDPTAKALGFVPDASKVSAATAPTYKAGSKCSTCAQYTGKPGDASGPCNIFAGHTVPAGGWCSVWAAKPA